MLSRHTGQTCLRRAAALVVPGAAGLSLALAFGGGLVQAADDANGFTLSGGFRLRYETIAGQPRLSRTADDDLFSLRSRLRLGYRHDWLSLVGEIRDSRAYGAAPGTPLTTGEVNVAEPLQAYLQADFHDLAGRGSRSSLRIGRFAEALGSSRLIANDDYRNTTNGFTGIQLDSTWAGGWTATALALLPQRRLPEDRTGLSDNAFKLDQERASARLWAFALSRQRSPETTLAEIVLLRFGESDRFGRPSLDRALFNLNPRLFQPARRGRTDWGLEGIWQVGRVSDSLRPDAPRRTVAAFFLHAQAGYRFDLARMLRIGGEVDYASGDGPGGRNTRFDTLFGSRRYDFGPGGLYAAIGRANIASPGARLEYAPGARSDILVAYRALWLANRRDAFATTGLRDASGASGAFAGHQIDLRARYWLVPKHVQLETDAVYLARGEFLRQAPNAPQKNTRFLSLNLSTFF